MSPPVDPPEPSKTRPLAARQARQNVLLSAEISGFGGGTPSKHRIRDLSSTGARIDAAGMLRAGSTVLVSVGVLEQIGATVVWVRDGMAGLQFAEPIDPDAARSKAIVAPPPKPAVVAPTPPGATAGWVTRIDDAYRK